MQGDVLHQKGVVRAKAVRVVLEGPNTGTVSYTHLTLPTKRIV